MSSLKIGTRVLVINNDDPDESLWIEEMRDLVGETGVIVDADEYYTVQFNNDHVWALHKFNVQAVDVDVLGEPQWT